MLKEHNKENEVCAGATTFAAGVFAILFAIFLTIPLAVNIATNSGDVAGFTAAIFVSAILGIQCILGGKIGRISKAEAIYLACFVWILLALIAAIPFTVSESTNLSYSDALFEAMSGLTTTGATVLCNLQEKSPGILLWRAMLHAIGGLGIITIGIFLLPWLKVSALKDMYYTESSGRMLKHGIFRAILHTVCIYIALTVLCIACYKVAGMSMFDAICHGLSTVSTGGFSNYDDSFMHFNSVTIELIAITFMLLASCPFIAYIQVIFEHKFSCKQFIFFVAVTLSFALLVSISPSHPGATYLTSLRYAVFTIVSFSTSTGFVNCNYNDWTLAVIIGIVLTICGGCSGSTNGGIKMHRIMILLESAYKHVCTALRLCRSPSENFSHQHLSSLHEACSFLVLYILIFCITCIALSWDGLGLATIITATSSTLSNTGIGVGDYIGPSGNFAGFPQHIKVMLVIVMLTGRLEIMPVMAFLVSALQISIRKMLKVLRIEKILDMFP